MSAAGPPQVARRRIALLGATGSIATSALDVVARHPERFDVIAVAANRNAEKLLDVCRRFRPAFAAMLDGAAARALAAAVAAEGLPTRVGGGPAALIDAAVFDGVDTVLAAIVGAAGLAPTLAAARSGRRVLLANKEALVIGGALFMAAAEAGGATIVPIDSEHNAIHQCLPPSYARQPDSAGIRRLMLTASGGPFRTRPVADLVAVTPDEACAHPKWRMGRKISVDSATMMNKGLEVIEAHWLFGVAADAIEVVIHPESVIHSLVEYVDGSVLAQLGHPDMRTPIAQALAAPERVDAGVARLDLAALGRLSFEKPDYARFPCLALAYDALRAGGSAPIVLNAANEIAVAAFLAGQARYTDIPATCEALLSRGGARSVADLDDALAIDADARCAARERLALPAVGMAA